jgi:ATP-dependent DNA helicase RecG
MSEEQRILAAQIATKRKAPVSAVRDVIQRLCAGRFFTSDELAQLLKRNPDGLRNRYLTPMVAEGILKLRYPETPNRPDQAYTASEVAK